MGDGRWEEWRAGVAMLGMVAVLVLGLGFQGSARDESRAYLGRGGARSRALRVRGVRLDPIVRRGGGGGRRGGERRARSMTLSVY